MKFVTNLIFTCSILICYSAALPLDDNAIPKFKRNDVIDLSHYGSRMYGVPSEEAGRAVAESDPTKINPEELGPYVEGDILIPRPAGKNGIIGEAYRWPKGKIPYEISPSFDTKSRNLILKAMGEYHKHTCIKFTPRTSADRDYIYITNTNTGCWSSVGRMGGRQELNLQSPGCTTLIGTSIHEIMHAVGFMHEQNRYERDSWITVLNQNISPGYEGNFAKMKSSEINAQGVQYDYESVMHYNLNAFSRNGQPTMRPLKRTAAEIGQRKRFSSLDIEKINRMYKCSGGSSGLDEPAGGLGGIVSGIFGFIGPDGIEDAEELVKDQEGQKSFDN